ncbi:NAD(P)/FAD-dependent oxidoreductase [Streptomyces sp. NPDC057908]|uniref:NAD(P)/FAD-dependent oxidoreductase n=1 Tax=Streptomyces sp. NPDC057908 TaxID=3346276 RepID=UPI0036EB6902
MTDRIVIAGASLAGVHAAEELRAAGYDGELTMLSAETEPPYDRPPLSKQFLAGSRDQEQLLLRPPDAYDTLGIRLHLGTRASGLDLGLREVRTDDGHVHPYDGLVIATGSRPRWPAGLPRLEGMYTLRTLADARRLAEEFTASPRVAVLGGGFIGAEVAATARGLGLDVILLEAAPTLLGRALGPVLGDLMTRTHRDRGVDVRCGATVTGVTGGTRVDGLLLADGTLIAADVVVVGVGNEPVTDWLEGSGLRLDDGVVCDEFCATDVPGIVAAGDVARWRHPRLGMVRSEHHSNAVDQGMAAARTLLGERSPYAPVSYVWYDQYAHKIHALGSYRPGDETRMIGPSLACFVRAGRVVGAAGVDARREVTRMRGVIERGEPCPVSIS